MEGAGCRQKGNKAESLSGEPSFSVKLDEFDDTADLFGRGRHGRLSRAGGFDVFTHPVGVDEPL